MAPPGVSNTGLDWTALGPVSDKGAPSASISGTNPLTVDTSKAVDISPPAAADLSPLIFKSVDYSLATKLKLGQDGTSTSSDEVSSPPTSRLSSMIRNSSRDTSPAPAHGSSTAKFSILDNNFSTSSLSLSSTSSVPSLPVSSTTARSRSASVSQSTTKPAAKPTTKPVVTSSSKRSWLSNIGKKVIGSGSSTTVSTNGTASSPKSIPVPDPVPTTNPLQRSRSLSSSSTGGPLTRTLSVSSVRTNEINIPGTIPSTGEDYVALNPTTSTSSISSQSTGNSIAIGSADTMDSTRSGGRLMSRIKRLSVSKGSSGPPMSVSAPLSSSLTNSTASIATTTASSTPVNIISANSSSTQQSAGSLTNSFAPKSPVSSSTGLSSSSSVSSMSSITSTSSTSSFLQTLKRKTTISSSSSTRHGYLYPPAERMILNKNPSRDLESSNPLVSETKLKPLREVSFALNTFCRDPPQQVPPRDPKVGNLTAGTNNMSKNNEFASSNNVLTKVPSNQNEPILRGLIDTKKDKKKDTKKDTIKSQMSQTVKDNMASNNINNIAVKGPGIIRSAANSLEGTKTTATIATTAAAVTTETAAMTKDSLLSPQSAIRIDLPMKSSSTNLAELNFQDPNQSSSSTVNNPSSAAHSAMKEKVDDTIPIVDFDGEIRHCTLGDIYTRCSHLREILPISTTMKQIQGKKSPLNLFKLMNLRPTTVEILALSDFLSVVPCMTVVLDNSMLSVEHLRLILTALLRVGHIEKLSLMNVGLNKEGWQILCLFVAANKTMRRLDISQHLGRKDAKGRTIEDPKECHRYEMDWPLLVKAIKYHGGIEEIILNGCSIPSENFAELVQGGFAVGTKRVGLASSNMGRDEFQILANWATDNSRDVFCEGLDIGDNDLSDKLDILLELAKKTKHLRYLSLHSTGVSDPEQGLKIVEALSNLPFLKFLNLSGIAILSPTHMRRFAQLLSKFPELRRLHVDSNDLSNADLIILSEAFATCKTLMHISLMDNPRFEQSGLAALVAAINLSSTIYLVDTDSPSMSAVIKRRLDYYCMRNVESAILGPSTSTILLSSQMADNAATKVKDADDDIVAEDEDLIDFGSELCDAVDHILVSHNGTEEVYEEVITKALADRASYIRVRVAKLLDDLSLKRSKGELHTEGKELLIRLFVLDASLYEVLKKYAHHVDRLDKIQKQKLEVANSDKSKNVSSGYNSDDSDDDDDDEGLSFNILPAKNEHLLVTDKSYQFMQPLADVAPPVAELTETVTSFNDPISPNMSENHSVVIKGTIVENEEVVTLSRNSSLTSLHSKRLVAEEGELHKLGFYMHSTGKAGASIETRRLTGEELRQAVGKAKGRGTVVGLIEKLTKKNAHFGDILAELRVSENGVAVEPANEKNNENMDSMAINSNSPSSLASDAQESTLAPSPPGSQSPVNVKSDKKIIDDLLDDFEKARLGES